MSDAEPRDVRVLVVDDEPLARDFLRRVIEELPGVSLVRECADGVEAVEAIREHQPDLVLLDVRMPEVSGFDVISQVDPSEMPEVIFVTAHEEYTLRAFEVHALDYVVKPFDPERLGQAIEHARRRVVAHGRRFRLPERLDALIEEMRDRSAVGGGYARRVTVREDDTLFFVDLDDVDWIEAAGNYVDLHVGTGTHRVRTSLRGLLDRLDPATFVRIHRSAVVNLGRVQEVRQWFGGDYLAVLETGEELRVSRTYRDRLLRMTH